MNIETALQNDNQCDVDADDLYVELKLLQKNLPDEKMGAIDILNYLKRLDCFPNGCIAYRILLTILVTAASAERSFSKLKLLKTYLRSTTLQKRLNGLALVAIEEGIMEKKQYEDLIKSFVSKNARRISLFL